MSSYSSLLVDIGGTNMRYAYANKRNISEEKILSNISDQKINELEIPTGNPLIIEFDNNLKTQKYYYLDETRAKPIIFNQ